MILDYSLSHERMAMDISDIYVKGELVIYLPRSNIGGKPNYLRPKPRVLRLILDKEYGYVGPNDLGGDKYSDSRAVVAIRALRELEEYRDYMTEAKRKVRRLISSIGGT